VKNNHILIIAIIVTLGGCTTLEKKNDISTEESVSFEVIGALVSMRLSSIFASESPLTSSTGPRSTRVFSDRESYPPERFAAYGIVAFSSRATDETSRRYMTICKAYVASIPHRSEVDIPKISQMVTVWPVETADAASKINAMARKDVCKSAVETYDLATSLTALSHASAAGAQVDGLGPYLLAWSPATDKGQQDALVLVKDMSNVNTSLEAINTFTRWRKEIELDPDVWESGWNIETVKSNIRQFVDFYGPQVSELFE